MIKIMKMIFDRFGVHSREEVRALAIQFIKFGLVGLSNTLISWFFYYLFLWINEDLYLVGSIVGGVVSIANAFFWNDRFVFKGKNNDLKSKLSRLVRTYVSYGGTSILAIALLWTQINLLGVPKTIAPLTNLLITVPLNFLINKLWAFK